MAKHPNNHNSEALEIYNRQSKNLTMEEAQQLMKDHPELADALTELFFSPTVSKTVVADLLNLNDEFNKAKAHAKDRDAAIAARKEAEDAVDSYVKGLFDKDPSVTQEWLDKASPAAKLQKAKDIIAKSLEAAVGSGKGSSSKTTPISSATQKRIDKLIEEREKAQSDLNEAQSTIKELESKVRLAEQAKKLAEERLEKAGSAIPTVVTAPDANAIAAAKAEGKAAAEAEAEVKIKNIKTAADAEVAKANAEAEKRVAQAQAEAKQATETANAAKKQLEAFSEAKAKAVTWATGAQYSYAVFSRDTNKAVPDEIVRAIKEFFPNKYNELLGRRACAEFEGELKPARAKDDPDSFIEGLPL